MTQAIFFVGPRAAQLQPFPVAAPGPGEVRVRTLVSLISTGTETICFARRFDPGTHWDHWVKYPFRPGYSTVARVEEVGEGVSDLRPGDRIVARAPHGSHHVLPAVDCTLVPEGLGDEDAAWFALAKIAFVGMLAAQVEIGARVLVIGAGPIGQMTTRWCAAVAAADVVTVDPVEGRLALAEAGGATATVRGTVGERQDEIVAVLRGHRPDVVIDTTGNAHAFADALRVAADFGRVVLLGDTGSPASQSLTPDVITRGLTLVGAHDGHTGKDAKRWDHDREIFRLFFRLVVTGRFPLDGMITQRFDPSRAQEAYDFAEDHREGTMGLLFNWETT